MLIACVILYALVCTACQSSKADEKIETAIDQGDYALAVSLLKKQKHVAKNTILENLNLSLLMHWAEQYDKSSALMNPTDNLLMESAQLNLARSFGTAVLNDNSATYAGTVYEYLYINAFNALNYYNAGKLEDALVEVRKLKAKQEQYISNYGAVALKPQDEAPDDSKKSADAARQFGLSKDAMEFKGVKATSDNIFRDSATVRYVSMALHSADGDNGDGSAAALDARYVAALSGIDTAEGIKHCGGAEAYLDALTVFAESVESSADEIERYYKNAMWHDYTVKVHALKSTARVIGAAELSEKARRLEKAGNSGYIDEIKQHTEHLLYLYRGYGQILRPLISGHDEDTAAENKPLIDAADLADAYEAMRDMAASFDYDSMMSVFDSLSGYRLPESDAAKVDTIKLAALKPDWDKVRELLCG